MYLPKQVDDPSYLYFFIFNLDFISKEKHTGFYNNNIQTRQLSVTQRRKKRTNWKEVA